MAVASHDDTEKSKNHEKVTKNHEICDEILTFKLAKIFQMTKNLKICHEKCDESHTISKIISKCKKPKICHEKYNETQKISKMISK